MQGDIILPDKGGILYTVTREKQYSSHISVGTKLNLIGNQDAWKEVIKQNSEMFAS